MFVDGFATDLIQRREFGSTMAFTPYRGENDGTQVHVHARPTLDSNLGEAFIDSVFRSDVVVRLPQAMVLQGTIVDEEGAGIVRARVSVAPHRFKGVLLTALAPDAVTDANGRFFIGGLGVGPYVLSASPPSPFTAPVSAVVQLPSQPIRLKLPLGATEDVRIVDENGAPVPGTLLRLSGTKQEVVTNERGVARLAVAPRSADFSLAVHPPDDRLDLADEVVIRDLRAGDVVIPTGQSLSGTLRSGGLPLADVWVSCEPAEPQGHHVARERGARTDQQGRFTVRRLPAGKYRLRPRVGSEVVETVAIAGNSGIEIVVPPLGSLRVRLRPWRNEFRGAVAMIQDGSVTRLARVGPGGYVRFLELTYGKKYDLWVGQVPGGRYAWARGLKPGSDVVDVPVQRGRTVTVSLELPPGGRPEEWLVVSPELPASEGGDTPFRMLRNDVNMTITINGVPARPWAFIVIAQRKGEDLSAHVEATPGVPAVAKLGLDADEER